MLFSRPNNEEYGGDDEDDSYDDLPSEGFLEYEATHDDGSQWLERAENCHHGATNALHAVDQSNVGHEGADY